MTLTKKKKSQNNLPSNRLTERPTTSYFCVATQPGVKAGSGEEDLGCDMTTLQFGSSC